MSFSVVKMSMPSGVGTFFIIYNQFLLKEDNWLDNKHIFNWGNLASSTGLTCPGSLNIFTQNDDLDLYVLHFSSIIQVNQ